MYAALNYVLMNVAHTEARKGNSFYGIAVGLVVMAGAVAGGPISGGAVCALQLCPALTEWPQVVTGCDASLLNVPCSLIRQ